MKEIFCENEEAIENYNQAKNENFKRWQTHHRLETHNSDGEKRLVNITVEELKALDMYYNRPAEELIFLRLEEHTKIHFQGSRASEEKKSKISQSLKGHIITDATREKIKNTLKDHKMDSASVEKIRDTTIKRMAIVKKTYVEKYKGKMSWNEFQKFWSDGSKAI